MQGELNGVQKTPHHQLQPSVEQGAGAPAEDVPLVKQFTAQDAGDMKDFLYQLGTGPFQGPAVVHGVDLHDSHAAAVGKFLQKLGTEGIFIHGQGAAGPSVQQAELVLGGQTVGCAVLGHHLGVGADEDQTRPAALIFYAGVGGHGGGQGHIFRLGPQRRRDLLQGAADAYFQVVAGGLSLGGKENFIGLPVVDHCVCAGAAGVNADADHACASVCMSLSDKW